MALPGRERDQVGAREDRAAQRDVGKVRSAAGVRVVGNDHITGFEVLAACDGFLDRVAERAEEAGDAVALGDELAVGVGDTAREGGDLVDDRALRGALQRDEHLVADCREPLAQHVHGEPDVGEPVVGEPVVASHGRSSKIRLPASSCRAAWPGRTSVVAAGSSITHGPATQSWSVRVAVRSASSARARTGISCRAPYGSRSTSRARAGGCGPGELWSVQLISALGSIALTRSDTTSSGASSRNA